MMHPLMDLLLNQPDLTLAHHNHEHDQYRHQNSILNTDEKNVDIFGFTKLIVKEGRESDLERRYFIKEIRSGLNTPSDQVINRRLE